jgi:replicative DNA helicase
MSFTVSGGGWNTTNAEERYGSPAPPSLVEQKREQHDRVIDRMDMETDGRPDLAYPDLVDVTGPLLPGQLWITLARPENGKTTFCLNLCRKWITEHPRHGWVYFGTEEGTETQILRFAAMLSGNPPAAVVAGEWRSFCKTENEIVQAQREVLLAIQDITSGKYVDHAFFAEATRPTLLDVRRAAEEAVRLGLPILVLDHFHRMAVPESENTVATLTETVRRIKHLAVETGLTILMAAQAKRVEGLSRFMPPNPESGKGTGGLEEEADVMLGLFKPIGVPDGTKFRPLTKGERDAYERGELNQDQVLQPHTMGVKVLKHRRNGDYSGRIIKLHCEHGILANHSGRMG